MANSGGGAVVVGTTLGLAAMAGALPALAIAAGIGVGTHAATKRQLNKLPDSVLAIQQDALAAQQRFQGKVTEAELKALEKKTATTLASCKEVCEEQHWGNREVAVLCGLAGFACPVLGLVFIAALTSDTWLPRVERWLPDDREPVIYRYRGKLYLNKSALASRM